MKLRTALEEKKYDVRLMDRHIAEGTVKNDEAKEFYSKLEDNSGNFEEIKIGETVQEENFN